MTPERIKLRIRTNYDIQDILQGTDMVVLFNFSD